MLHFHEEREKPKEKTQKENPKEKTPNLEPQRGAVKKSKTFFICSTA